MKARIAEAIETAGVRASRAAGRRAAVLVPLIQRDDGLWIVFTRRTEDVPTHKGQVSFPGGGQDPGDADLYATALREAEEEIGLAPDQVQLVGRLNDYATISGFVVAPFVAFIPDGVAYCPNPRECAEVIEVPVRDLLEEGYFAKVLRHSGLRRAVLFYRARGQIVWGATAAMLRDLLERIRDVVL